MIKNLFICVFCLGSVWGSDSYEDLVQRGLISRGDKPSLHLGCGENHINGDINIDFPLENRPLHTGTAVDYHHDITTLCFPDHSVDKIENHHVFEHFSRPMALALLCAWHTWLCQGGILIIETPDFDGGIRRYLNTSSFEEKQIIIRQLFGSHEESWAVHWDGWYKEKLIHILTTLGFRIESVRCYSWRSLDNIEVIAIREQEISPDNLKKRAMELLRMSMVDDSISENKMWEKWCIDFNKALDCMLKL